MFDAVGDIGSFTAHILPVYCLVIVK